MIDTLMAIILCVFFYIDCNEEKVGRRKALWILQRCEAILGPSLLDTLEVGKYCSVDLTTVNKLGKQNKLGMTTLQENWHSG